VETRIVLVDGRLALACAAEGASLETTRLARALGAHVVTSGADELPDEFRGAPGPIPPTGGLFGVPLFVDDEVPKHGLIVFRAFAAHDYVELSYDDFARIERPRVTSFATWGELPAYSPPAAHPA